MNEAWRERVLGGAGAVFAAAYIAGARAIEDSLLSDAVGAGGVPQAAGIALLIASLTLLGRSFAARPASHAQRPGDAAAIGGPWRPWQRGAALAAVLVAYVLLLPWLGYIPSLSALVLAAALLAGARPSWALALVTALSGAALWALFEGALKIRLPAGSIWG